MAKLTLTIAEAWERDGKKHFICEFTKKRKAIGRDLLQRPTFEFPLDTPDTDCYQQMRKAVEAQEKLSKAPRKPRQVEKHIGKKI